MLRLAITGGVACGKSTVGSFLSANNIPVCDADDLAHRLIDRAAPAYRRIVRLFGTGILGRGGQIARAKLGKIVFAEPKRLAALNGILHPLVKKEWERWIAGVKGARACAVIVPLLYEARCEGPWDKVICVSASERDQRDRLRLRGLSKRGIELRLKAQMPVSLKMELADYVIYNSGSLKMLEEQTVRVMNELLESQHGRERKRKR